MERQGPGREPGLLLRESGVSERVIIARLLRPQGRRGELLAELLTDFPERFEGRAVCVGDEERVVESHFLPVGKNAGRVVLKFAGVESINEAEKMAGKDVTIAAEERAVLGEDESYIHELVGCTVLDGEREVGTVVDVLDLGGAPAQTLLVRDAAGTEHMVPYVKAFTVSVETAERRIRMRLPEGLIGLNK